MRRWLFRILLILLVVLVIAAIAVQIVLWTDLPRRLVLATLQRELALRIEASSVSTGWLGNTTVRDVTLALPLSERAFLKVPELRVSHTMLPRLLLGAALRIQSLEFDRPDLIVRQGPTGRWNVAEALSLAGRAGGAEQSRQEAPAGRSAPPRLPELRVNEGTIHLVDRKGRSVDLAPLSIDGRPASAVAYALDLSIGPDVSIRGQIASAWTWAHRASFYIANPHWLKPWLGAAAQDALVFSGEWRGHWTGQEMQGRLRLDEAQYGGLAANGTFNLSLGQGPAVITPDQAWVWSANTAVLPSARLVGGQFSTDGGSARVNDLRLELLGGMARFTGEWSAEQDSASLALQWFSLHPGNRPEISVNGSLKLNASRPWPGQPQVGAELVASASAPGGRWDGSASLNGWGANWSDMTWQATVPQLQLLRHGQTWKLDNLVASLRSTGTPAKLESLVLQDLHVNGSDRVAGEGRYSFSDGRWFLNLLAREMTLPYLNTQADFELHTSGNPQRVDVSMLSLHAGFLQAISSGSYVYAEPKPLDARVIVQRIPLQYAGTGQRHVGGELHGELRLVGTLWPLNLTLGGMQPGAAAQLFGDNLIFGERRLGDVVAEIEGTIDGTAASIQSRKITLLDGQWTLGGTYRFARQTAQVDVAVRDLALRQTDAFFSPPPNLLGTLEADLQLNYTRHQSPHASVGGQWRVRDLRLTISPNTTAAVDLAADEIQGGLLWNGGAVQFPNLRMRRGDGRAEGRAELDRGGLRLTLSGAAWPLSMPNLALALNAGIDTRDLLINFESHEVRGPLNVSTTVQVRGQPAGNLRIRGEMAGRRYEVRELAGWFAGGKLSGTGTIPFDDFVKTVANLHADDVSLPMVSRIWPEALGSEGQISLDFTAGPDADPRAVGPMQMRLALRTQGAAYRGVTIGQADLSAHGGYETGAGGYRAPRLILHDSTLSLADGQVELWAMFSRHAGDVLRAHLGLKLNDLDLDQIVHAGDALARPMPGRLSADLTVFGDPRQRSRLTGQATARLTQSDLANSAPIAAIYNALNLSLGDTQPTGHGDAEAYLQNGQVRIPRMHFFNRGVEIRGAGVIADIWQGGRSPVDGDAAGSLRPLRSLRLPYAAQLDDILFAIQGQLDMSSVHIGGMLGKPVITYVPFAQTSAELRRFFVGEVQSAGGQ